MAKKTGKPKKVKNPAQGTKTQGSTIGTPAQAQAAQLGAAARPESVSLGPVREIEGSQIGNIERVATPLLDTSQSGEFRQRQMSLADQLQAQARGEGPSLAQMQLQRGTDQAIGNQLAFARSGRGMANPALAMRQAQQQIGSIGQAQALDAAMARLQEQRTAQQQLGGLLESGRGQDVKLETAQGELGLTASLANQAAFNANQQRQAELNQSASLSNQQAYNTGLGQQAGLNQESALAYANALNQTNLAQGGFTQQANIFNAGAINTAGLTQAQINAELEKQRIAAAASARAAGIGAGASNYATDASLYKFNATLANSLDEQGYNDQNRGQNAYYQRGQNSAAADAAASSAVRDAAGQVGSAAAQAGALGGGGAKPTTAGMPAPSAAMPPIAGMPLPQDDQIALRRRNFAGALNAGMPAPGGY